MPIELQHLLSMTPSEFEELITALIGSLGFQAERTQPTNDGGIDVWAVDDAPLRGSRIIIQCKRYNPGVAVGEPVVREFYGLVHHHAVNKGILITSSKFTPGAVHFAEGKPLELIDGEMLLSILNRCPSGMSARILQRKVKLTRASFTDYSTILQDLERLKEVFRRPYPLHFVKSPEEIWANAVDQWDLEGMSDIGLLVILMGIYEAAYLLVEGASFITKETTWGPNAYRILQEQILGRIKELTEIFCKLQQQNPEKVNQELDYWIVQCEPLDDELTLVKAGLSIVETNFQGACSRFWWKD